MVRDVGEKEDGDETASASDCGCVRAGGAPGDRRRRVAQETVLTGYVIRGSWNGKNLAGASVRARAHRVFPDGTIFAGKVTISR